MKKIVILDAETLGDVEIEKLKEFGEVVSYDTTTPEQVEERVKDANIILTIKVSLNRENLKNNKKMNYN